MVIEASKYARNALLFNLGFVLDSTESVIAHQQVIQKLALFLQRVEIESEFLSSTENLHGKLEHMMNTIMTDLNTFGQTSITIGSNNVIQVDD